MPMGVLAPGSAHAGPFAQLPIDMIGNFPAKFAFNHLIQPLRSHIRSFRTPREVFLGKKNNASTMASSVLVHHYARTNINGRGLVASLK